MIIPCLHCGKMTIEAREVPDTYLYKRGFTGKKGFQFQPGRTVVLTRVCSNCKKEYKDKEEIAHEQRLERYRKAGLPTQIRG